MRKSRTGGVEKANRRAAAPPARQSESPVDWRPTQEQISMRAYEIYLANGAQDGRDKDDWFEAERLLMSEGFRSAL